MAEKKYEITGVIIYVHAIGFEVVASNQKEALIKAKMKAEGLIDSSMAEFEEMKIDKPVLLKEI